MTIFNARDCRVVRQAHHERRHLTMNGFVVIPRKFRITVL